MLLSNKVIFLTGGSTGIGWECARAYVAAGASVVLCARRGEQAEEAARRLPGEHFGIACDVSQGEDVRRAFDFVMSRFDRLDAIHNNAGIAHPAKPLDETSEEEWVALTDTNLKSIYWTTRYGYQHLKASQGTILNTSSLVGEIGQHNHAAYTATKGGIDALTKSMALDYAADGVRVNAVSPAGVWTPMLHQWCQEQPNPDSVRQYLDDIHPLGYCPDGDVIADACVFLLSDKARFITGCILPVGGGAELGYKR